MTVLIADGNEERMNEIFHRLDWIQLGVREVCRASRYETAVEALENGDIRIVICDIDSPGLRGMELLRLAHSASECSRHILLTEQPLLRVAQEALDFGPFQFILWTAQWEELEQAVKQAVELVEQAELQLKAMEYYRWQSDDDERTRLMQDFFHDPQADSGQLLLEFRDLGIHIVEGGQFQLVLKHVLEKKDGKVWWNQVLLKDRLDQLMDTTKDYWGGDMIPGRMGYGLFLLIFQLNEDPVKRQHCTYLLNRHLQACTLDEEHPVAFYVGRPAPHSQLHQRWNAILHLLRSNVAGEPHIFFEEHLAPSILQADMPDWDRWKQQLAHGGVEQVRGYAHRYLDSHKVRGVYQYEVLARFHQDFVAMVLEAAKEKEQMQSTIFTYYFDTYMGAYTNLDDMHRFVDIAMDILSSFQHKEEEDLSPVHKAMLYINENLENKLDRQEVADHVHLSPEHLSRLFKRETGMTLRDYVSMHKLEMARTMLDETSAPVSQVAVQLGYHNFSYFSQLFREHTGLSPLEYRHRRASGNGSTGKAGNPPEQQKQGI